MIGPKKLFLQSWKARETKFEYIGQLFHNKSGVVFVCLSNFLS